MPTQKQSVAMQQLNSYHILCKFSKYIHDSDMNILSLNPWRVKQFTKQACQENVVASFFPLKIFILLCFNVLSTVPRESRLADSLYIYIYIYIYLIKERLHINHFSELKLWLVNLTWVCLSTVLLQPMFNVMQHVRTKEMLVEKESNRNPESSEEHHWGSFIR